MIREKGFRGCATTAHKHHKSKDALIILICNCPKSYEPKSLQPPETCTRNCAQNVLFFKTAKFGPLKCIGSMFCVFWFTTNLGVLGAFSIFSRKIGKKTAKCLQNIWGWGGGGLRLAVSLMTRKTF